MASLTLAPNPWFTGFDDDGNIVPGGKLFTYEAGTSTKLATYTTRAGNVANSNPIILDTAGRVPSGLYLLSQSYKFVLSPADDTDPPTNPIRTQDGIGAVPTQDLNIITTEAELTAILAEWSTTTIGTLTFVSVVALAVSHTIPSNITVQFLPPGAWNIASGRTMTVQGPISAVRSQIFQGSGTVDLTDAKLDWVYPEWWGAVPLKAASGTPVDSTAACQAAVNSRRDVLYDQGIYGATDEILIATDGQTVQGQGMQVVGDGQGGTTILRLSGTNRLVRGGSFVGTTFRGFKLDGNNLGGNVMQWQSLYSLVEQVRFARIASSGYAIFLSSVNLSTFRDVTTDDTCYGGIKSDSANQALYTSFYSCNISQTTGGYGLDLENVAGLNFYSLFCDGPIYLHGVNESTHFTDLRGETSAITTQPYFLASGSDVLNPVVRGARIFRNVASTYPEFSVVSAKSASFCDVYYNDLFSLANKPLIQLNAAAFPSITNVEAYTTNACNVVNCVTARSDNMRLEQIYTHSGATGELVLWTAVSTVAGSNCNISFPSTSESIALSACTGTVTRTNGINFAPTVISGGEPIITFSANDATPNVAQGFVFLTNNSNPTTITDFDFDGSSVPNGYQVYVKVNDANTTFDFSGNANMTGNAGVDFAAASGDQIIANSVNGVWICLISRKS